MNIEVGKTYMTRSGDSVLIEHGKGDNFYPFFGMIVGGDGKEIRIAYFTNGGQYSIGQKTIFDIVGCAYVQR